MSQKSMDPERWKRIKEILFTWSVASPERQKEILREVEQEDPALRVDLEEFLELDETLDHFIEEPLWSFLKDESTDESGTVTGSIGRRVGPYRIEKLLGYGGMGSVYLASREDDYEQQVALKWVREDSDNAEIVSRFYAERQILAHLVHPGIARLLDGGTSADGRPYLAMEFVDGEPIDTYCEKNHLSIDQRLRLFRKVCVAVHFAHQNLVVHRDLKPSNILVTADGNPRLLDFGIAKLLRPELPHASAAATLPGQSPMTPAYASPEQLRAEPITTASDIYALGVLLYRLLAARPPYRLEGKGYHEVLQLICFEYPTRPSEAVLGGEDRRPAGPGERRWAQKLSGDLDSIVLKAMRKEPEQRYGSAAELSEDISRHLEGQPVQARQGNWLYLTSRTLRRNKPVLATLLFVIGFALTTTFLWRQAESQRERAEQGESTARTVTNFLEDLFRSADPDEAKGRDLRVLEVLERGRARLEGALGEEPETRAEILGTLGAVYQNLGLFEQSAELLVEAYENRMAHDPTDRRELAKDINNVATSYYAAGSYERAERYFRQALAMYQRLDPADPHLPAIMHNLASTLRLRGRPDEAEVIQGQILERSLRIYGPRSPEVATSLFSFGILKRDLGDLPESERLLQRALEIRTERFSPHHTKVAEILSALGRTLFEAGRLGEARQLLERALRIRLDRFEEDHPTVAVSRSNLAEVLLELGEIEAAGDLARLAFDSLSASLPEKNGRVANARRVLGAVYFMQGDFHRAEIELRGSYFALRESRGEEASATEHARRLLLEIYRAWGREDPERALEYPEPSSTPAP